MLDLRRGAVALAAFTLLVGLLYPLLLFGIGQVAFGDRADGSLLRDAGGRVVGSSLIGQAFDAPQYFWGRPSAAGDGYDGGASGASNLGPTSRTLADTVQERIDALLKANPGRTAADIPAELVTASGSGLDPHISPAGPGPRVPRRAAGERAAAQPGPRYAPPGEWTTQSVPGRGRRGGEDLRHAR